MFPGDSSTAQARFTCDCAAGYTGVTCDVPLAGNPCDPSPCLNGGQCLVRGAGTSFVCACPSGTWRPTFQNMMSTSKQDLDIFTDVRSNSQISAQFLFVDDIFLSGFTGKCSGYAANLAPPRSCTVCVIPFV